MNVDKAFWWILGIIGAIVAGSVSSVMGHGERIATLEAAKLTTENRLSRIESKIDRLLLKTEHDIRGR